LSSWNLRLLKSLCSTLQVAFNRFCMPVTIPLNRKRSLLYWWNLRNIMHFAF
jgi:hypothetical protein